ncbi:hypothetical protein HanRHA438_Chr08g0355281 [Helianthus annuus]|nr:hypothetical protein HanRHA438_Chr08g0355281 [Helianthus annuus]
MDKNLNQYSNQPPHPSPLSLCRRLNQNSGNGFRRNTRRFLSPPHHHHQHHRHRQPPSAPPSREIWVFVEA